MCSSPSVQATTPPVTPAAAPAPPAAAPKPTQVGAGRKQQNAADFGNPDGPSTRRPDNSLNIPGGPGTGVNM